MGDQIETLASKLSTGDEPIYFESLAYPASTDYNASVAEGSANLINELNYLSTLCGAYAPAVILAGHSQGANVISDALGYAQWPNGPALTDRAKAMIKSVALFGDPQYWPSDSWNAPYGPSGYGVFQRNQYVRDKLGEYRVWGWPQGSTNPERQWIPKIRSYCADGDFFCQSNAGDGNFAIHNSYKTTTMDFARNWIRYMMTSVN